MKMKYQGTLLQAQVTLLKHALPEWYLLTSRLLLEALTIIFAGQFIKDSRMTGVGLAMTYYNIFLSSCAIGYSELFAVYAAKLKTNNLSSLFFKMVLQGVLVFMVALGPYFNLVYLPIEYASVQTADEQALLGQRESREHAILFLKATSINGYLDYLTYLLQHYLMAQQHSGVVYCQVLVMVFTLFHFNQFLTRYLQMETTGLILATVMTRVTGFLVLCAYSFIKRRQLQWCWPSRLVFNDWGEMLYEGLRRILARIITMSLFSMAACLATLCDFVTLLILIVQNQLSGLFTTLSTTIAHVTAVNVKRDIADTAAVKFHLWLGFVNVLLESSVLGVLGFVFSGRIMHLFSNDEYVRNSFGHVGWDFGLAVFLESVLEYLSHGVLAGLGQDSYVKSVTLLVVYTVTVPTITLIVLFTNLRLYGIYIGIYIYLLICYICYIGRLCGVSIAQIGAMHCAAAGGQGPVNSCPAVGQGPVNYGAVDGGQGLVNYGAVDGSVKESSATKTVSFGSTENMDYETIETTETMKPPDYEAALRQVSQETTDTNAITEEAGVVPEECQQRCPTCGCSLQLAPEGEEAEEESEKSRKSIGIAFVAAVMWCVGLGYLGISGDLLYLEK